MARPLRVEYPGARYHLMCRGNQGQDVFRVQEDVDLFIKTLGQVCERNGVVIHAWCIMSNHYHALVETPEGNLVDAMKWFQGTFTQRYNASHKQWGHLFQGRYKAKVIDDDDPSYFRMVSEYIHLNPADANLVTLGKLSSYVWSSYPLYLQPTSKRPKWLRTDEVMNACDIIGDTSKSRKAYEAYMNLRHRALVMRTLDSGEKKAWPEMERGWVHGSKEFRLKMEQCLTENVSGPLKKLTDGEQKRDLSELAAERVLDECLKHYKFLEKDLKQLAKSDPRKMLIAGLLRYHFPVSTQWVSDRLHMGHFTTISRAMKFYDDPEGKWRQAKNRILKFIDPKFSNRGPYM